MPWERFFGGEPAQRAAVHGDARSRATAPGDARLVDS
jgi:hypothetical protein